MSRAASRKRGNPKDTKRRGKKKISILSSEKIEYVDYKDVDLLKRFMSDRAKIKNRRVSGNDVQQQRIIARAVKNSREMGLLPYTNRVTTQRRGRNDRGDGPRRPRDEERGLDETELEFGETAEGAEVTAPEAPAVEAETAAEETAAPEAAVEETAVEETTEGVG